MFNFKNQDSLILNDILLRRKSALYIPDTQVVDASILNSAKLVFALDKNIQSLGFTLDTKLSIALIRLFTTLPTADMEALMSDLVDVLLEMVGADVEYTPFYPNFPNEVVETPEIELYVNAIVHYLTFGEYRPDTGEEERPDLIKTNNKLRTICLASAKDYYTLVGGIIQSKVSVSERDRKDFETAFQNLSSDCVEQLFNGPVVNKENLAYLVNMLVTSNHITLLKKVLKLSVTNAVDVLRIASILSGSKNATLSSSVRFKSFRNWERKLIMEVLEGCKNAKEDLQRQKHLTKMLARAIHPVTYKKQYPHAYEVFNTICSDTKVSTFNSKLEALIKTKDIEAILKLVSTRPGEFARRLNQILSLTDELEVQQTILKFFNECAVDVAPKVLMDMVVAFRTRNTRDIRYAAIKGDLAKLMEWGEHREPFAKPILDEVETILLTALKTQFAQKEELGKVYIAPTLDQAIFPTVLRNTGSHTRNYARGTRISFAKDVDIIRSFIYWDTIDDIDLSTVLYDEDAEHKGTVNFRNLTCRESGIIHSGDIVDGEYGAAEFIDIDIQKAIESGIRYISMNVNVYSSYCTFSDALTCYAGIMMRKADQLEKGTKGKPSFKTAQNGNLYESESVLIKADVKDDSRANIPYVIDLVERCVIITDFNPTVSSPYNAVQNQLDAISRVIKHITTSRLMSIPEVIKLHVEARGGQLVSDPDKADIVFDWETGITPFDLETLTSEWM